MIHAALPTPFAPRLRGGRLRACRRAVLSPKWGRKNGPSTSSGQTGKGLISMGEMIRMTMDDGAEIAVYHAQPEGDRRGGLVLIQEIFGVTDHIRELCDEYAADGYERTEEHKSELQSLMRITHAAF